MKKTIALLVVSAFALAACDLVERELPTKLEKKDEPTMYWSEVDGEYKYTPQGNMQSPVNIEGSVVIDLPPLEVKYGEVELNLENTGYMFMQEIPKKQIKNNVLTIDNTPFYLLSLHWHVPGEHEIKGKHAPMELHLVHRSSDDRYAVIGVFYQIGDANATVKKLFSAMESKKAPEGVTIDLRNLLPKNLSYYFYQGSLTTPPYTEGFKWYVLQNPQYISKDLLKQYKKMGLKPNARATQKIEQRNIKKVTVQ
jgi:carbonic anhydrase